MQTKDRPAPAPKRTHFPTRSEQWKALRLAGHSLSFTSNKAVGRY